jgi:hypothetical protein
MNIGPLAALPASLAGQSLAQAQGSEVERASQEATAQGRQVAAEKKAEAAAGIGATDAQGDEAHERDADGRRLWEDQLDLSRDQTEGQKEEETEDDRPRAANPGGTLGGQLDITG